MRTELLSAITAAGTDAADAHGPESLRRANLYGAASPKRLPRVRLQPADARVRRDLAAALLLAAHSGGDERSQPLEDELRNRKHREDQGLRPPMDQIQRLQDLHTTVPKALAGDRDCHGKKREWRVGYANSTSRGALSGMFEPFDAMREEVARNAVDQQQQAIAYPVTRASPAKIAAEMLPFDEAAARDEMERRTSVRRNQESAEDAHWCPASYSTICEKGQTTRSSSTGTLARDAAGSQPFPVRKVSGIGNPDAPPPRARKAPMVADERCMHKKQSLLAKAAASCARLRQRVDRSKDPKLRYALPVEDRSKQRAYRLGLEPVPSSFEPAADDSASNNSSSIIAAESRMPPPSATPSHERLRFRPRSAAGVNAPFRSLAALSSRSALSSLDPAPSVGKVAGAKRRPHSASVCYLGSSTVYCVDASSSHRSQQQQQLRGDESEELASSDFGSVLERERHKRRCNQSETLVLLSRRGMFHNLPVPQIFARLRRESLKNLTRRLQRAQHEKMSMEEYMGSCGMLATISAARKESSFQLDPVAQVGAVSTGGADTESTAPAPADPTPPVSAGTPPATSSSLLAMRRVLVVTRQQFHIALEAFNLSPADVNLLFSALDVNVEDYVALWEILCAVEKLQDGHAELRRARVQIKARDLPRDLDQLRQSFRIPNVTHAPLELPEARDESA